MTIPGYNLRSSSLLCKQSTFHYGLTLFLVVIVFVGTYVGANMHNVCNEAEGRSIQLRVSTIPPPITALLHRDEECSPHVP